MKTVQEQFETLNACIAKANMETPEGQTCMAIKLLRDAGVSTEDLFSLLHELGELGFLQEV